MYNNVRLTISSLECRSVCAFVQNKNIKVGDLFSRTCEHVGLKESDYFGLAQKKG